MIALKCQPFAEGIRFLNKLLQQFVKRGIWIVILLVFPTVITAQQTDNTEIKFKPIRKIDKYILPPSKQKIKRNPNIRYRYPIKNFDLYAKRIAAYKLRLKLQRERGRQRANNQQYERFQQQRTDLVKYKQEYLKQREENKNNPPPEEVETEEPSQLTPTQERQLQNKEILEGKRDPIVKDDPDYLKFIEERDRLTKRN